jgi:GT2 family glycosyltransferase
MTLKLAVVILNWNGKKFLEKFLPDLIMSCGKETRVFIADNNSSDGSVDYLRNNFPAVKIIKNPTNGGFSKGYNLALEQINAKYYCLLNSDIEVTKSWIQPILQMLDKDPSIAAVQPKILSYQEKDCFEYAGASGGYLDYLGYPFCRGRVFENLEKDQGQYNSPQQVFWATGAALFVRKEIYDRLGGLDEDFFAHMEEIDFCWRINNEGYKIMIQPNSVVYHVGGGTLPKNNSYKTYLNFRNNLFLLVKNLPYHRLFITLFIRFFLDQLAAFVFLSKGEKHNFKAVYKAIFHFIKMYPKMRKKRGKKFKKGYQLLFKESIVYAHYVKGKTIFDGETLK